jgi:hypothetical protein
MSFFHNSHLVSNPGKREIRQDKYLTDFFYKKKICKVLNIELRSSLF